MVNELELIHEIIQMAAERHTFDEATTGTEP